MHAFIVTLLLIAVALTGCSPPLESGFADGTGNATPLGRDEIANATYVGIRTSPVTLHDGHWEGAPFTPDSASRPRIGLIEGSVRHGDLDGDGRAEASALLWHAEGGSGTWIHLAVLARRAGRIVNLASVDIGDRVQVRAARIKNQQILLDMIQHGSNDAACCPGDKVRRSWTLVEDEKGTPMLREQRARRQGRLSLADLEGITWRLAENPPAPPGLPSITLRVEGRRVSGSGGCNRYFAEIADGDLPGALHLGPVASTRMACEGDVMAREDRYLNRLSRATHFGFRPGQLLLTLRNDHGDSGILTFSSTGPDEETDHARQQ